MVLDASALLAMLKEEPGASEVAGVLPQARIASVNLAEVVSHFAFVGMPRADIDAMLGALPMEIVSVDAALAREAGHLRPLTAKAGLSLGDRICLALAVRDKLPAWTSDRGWLKVSDLVGAEIVAIR